MQIKQQVFLSLFGRDNLPDKIWSFLCYFSEIACNVTFPPLLPHIKPLVRSLWKYVFAISRDSHTAEHIHAFCTVQKRTEKLFTIEVQSNGPIHWEALLELQTAEIAILACPLHLKLFSATIKLFQLSLEILL